VRLPRSSGLLLHPTSLPGPHGIGDLGPEAFAFVDLLAAAKQSLWQVLPLGPTGYGDSPYQCFSAFAGNPLLISLDGLLADGLLDRADLGGAPAFPEGRVDFGAVIPWKRAVLDRAADRFASRATDALRSEFESFVERESGWLEDFAMFMALKDAHGGAGWADWAPELRGRRKAALAKAAEAERARVHRHRVLQFAFFRQWRALRGHAAARGVRLLGDAPIFVSFDSADVWAHPDLFFLDGDGRPTVVAGVPPDYFSATGQRWGNPLYRWDRLAKQQYGWWIERLRAAFAQVDLLRLDHFIGFERYWEIPAGEPTAVNGRWVPGPGAALFEAAEKALGPMPIVAEDLGAVTPAVRALRDRFEFPGMRILQFAFAGGSGNPFLPHQYVPNTVAYTGTHDNDTARGWYATATEKERDFVRRYFRASGDDIAWDLVRGVWMSVADTAIAPVQDVLSLPGEARMNLPGREAGNWYWRLRAGQLGASELEPLAELTTLAGREPGAQEEPQP
jgi:4-alpha-glucanotransferase